MIVCNKWIIWYTYYVYIFLFNLRYPQFSRSRGPKIPQRLEASTDTNAPLYLGWYFFWIPWWYRLLFKLQTNHITERKSINALRPHYEKYFKSKFRSFAVKTYRKNTELSCQNFCFVFKRSAFSYVQANRLLWLEIFDNFSFRPRKYCENIYSPTL
jgi:hypothetical protein